MIKVCIVDDHKVVRNGIKQLLTSTDDILVAAECSNGYELFEELKSKIFDVIVLDISMPGMDGLDALKEIKKSYPNTPVLIFTMHAEDQYALRIIKAGASGYLCKDHDPEELIKAVRKIYNGGKYMSDRTIDLLASALQSGNEEYLHNKLSDREYQVMNQIAEGKNLSEIAENLSLSVNTISTYRSRILEKLGLHSNVDITKYALKYNLLKM